MVMAAIDVYWESFVKSSFNLSDATSSGQPIDVDGKETLALSECDKHRRKWQIWHIFGMNYSTTQH